MELKEYLALFRRWSWLLVLGLLLGAAGGWLASYLQAPVYQAITRILVMRAPQVQSTDMTYLSDQQLTQTYVQLLTTQPVLDGASAQLGFQVDPKQVNVQQIQTTQVIEMDVEDHSAKRAADIANVLVQVLISQNEKIQAGRYDSTEQSLQSQVSQVQGQITTLQSQIQNVSSETVQDQLSQVQAQITPLQNEVAQLQNDIASLSAEHSPTPEQQMALADKKTRLGQVQPVLALYQQIYTNLVVLGKPSDSGGTSTMQLSQLQSTLSLYQQIYINLLSSLETVHLARLQNTPNVVQIEAATQPDVPVRPKPVLYTLLAALVGLMLAGGIVFLTEYLNDTLKTMEDIEKVLHLPVVGTIADMKNTEGGEQSVHVIKQPRSPVSEAFRSLRTNLEFASVDKPLSRILVTSAGPSEGKTTVAVNLAAIIAQGGRRVMLLDADMRKPHVHHFLNIPNRIGLSDLFRGSLSPKSVAHRLEGLYEASVITSGSLPPNPTELLGSAKMDRILEEVCKDSDVVIVDSPPSLVADFQVLAAKVDGVVLVVQPGRTHADAAQGTLEQLQHAGAHVIGVVLNRIPRDYLAYGGYNHYSRYYRGYSYYRDEGREAGKEAKRGLAAWFRHPKTPPDKKPSQA